MMIRKLVLVTVLTVASSATFAPSGTPQEAGRVPPGCAPVLPYRQPGSGDGAFLACLQEHREKLRRACREVLESHGQ